MRENCFLNPAQIKERFFSRYPERFLTVDSHTAGEFTRLVLGPPVPGATMKEKREYFQAHLDRVRLLLAREPRGNRETLAAYVTEPVTPGADFGLIYMDARRYPQLCGHATIGAVTTLLELGALDKKGPEAQVAVDTPSGVMETRARFEGDKVAAVAVRSVPSFVLETGRELDVPGLGRVQVSTVCVGGFFVMISAEEAGLDISPANATPLSQLGMDAIQAANEQLTVWHPTRPEVRTVDVVEFYRDGPEEGQGRGLVVYGEAHIDRSPCGTGTSAKLTLLHHLGRIKTGESYVNAGPLGTTFQARVVEETTVGGLEGVVVEFEGRAHNISLQEFVVDPDDPFPQGFLL
ncbi:MAG: proline racemase family protein [Thermodesulfobacteriota bacterium]